MKTEIDRQKLDLAFKQTCYQINPETDLTFKLKIEKCSTDFAKWLDTYSINKWGILTPFNPKSRQLSLAENQHRLEELKQQLLENNYTFCPSLNLSHNNSWPEEEEGFFIFNISESKLLILAKKFQQLAAIYGQKDGIPRLLWTDLALI